MAKPTFASINELSEVNVPFYYCKMYGLQSYSNNKAHHKNISAIQMFIEINWDHLWLQKQSYDVNQKCRSTVASFFNYRFC